MSDPALHIALLGAFHFPVPQGSQVYVALQARALVDAGARVTLLSYGGRTRGSDDWPFEIEQTPDWTSPRSHHAGPRARKPLADAALLRSLIARHRVRRFDAVLAHNVEAAGIALLARPFMRVPVVYVAHTLLGDELGVYGPRALAGPAASLGRRLDREVARRSDAVIALCEPTRRALDHGSDAPVVCIPPGLTPSPELSEREIATACASHDLVPGGYALYSGNTDAYQDIEDLVSLAARLPELPVVIASHAPSRGRGQALAPVRVVQVADADEARALLFGAAVALCPRRVCPGFPIKLLNYMEAARPILARQGIGGTLRHGHDAWLTSPDADADAWALALRTLWDDAELRERLGSAARQTLRRCHAWPALARETLELVATVRDSGL